MLAAPTALQIKAVSVSIFQKKEKKLFQRLSGKCLSTDKFFCTGKLQKTPLMAGRLSYFSKV